MLFLTETAPTWEELLQLMPNRRSRKDITKSNLNFDSESNLNQFLIKNIHMQCVSKCCLTCEAIKKKPIPREY